MTGQSHDRVVILLHGIPALSIGIIGLIPILILYNSEVISKIEIMGA
jgi:hypothetical protein